MWFIRLQFFFYSAVGEHSEVRPPIAYYLPPSQSSPPSLPSSSSLTSLAAFSPSSRRFLSIILLRSTAALSSVLSVHPILDYVLQTQMVYKKK